MSKQPPPPPTARAVGPCPTLIQTSRTPRHLKFTQDHRTTRPPPPFLKMASFYWNMSARGFQQRLHLSQMLYIPFQLQWESTLVRTTLHRFELIQMINPFLVHLIL